MSQFVIAGPLWFLAPRTAFKSVDELCNALLEGVYQDDPTAEMIPIIYAFTDRDLAKRFVERAGQMFAAYVPIANPRTDAIIDLLLGLKRQGHHSLGIDSDDSSTRLMAIDVVIEQLRQRNDSNAGSP